MGFRSSWYDENQWKIPNEINHTSIAVRWSRALLIRVKVSNFRSIRFAIEESNRKEKRQTCGIHCTILLVHNIWCARKKRWKIMWIENINESFLPWRISKATHFYETYELGRFSFVFVFIRNSFATDFPVLCVMKIITTFSVIYDSLHSYVLLVPFFASRHLDNNQQQSSS